jgi:type IV pilus assembly protein PilB
MAPIIRKKLGEILLEANKITEEILARALGEQQKYGEKLGKVLTRVDILTEKEIIETLSMQLGIPIVRLDSRDIPKELTSLIPTDTAKDYMVIPLERQLNVLRLAMVDPLDIEALDEVARMAKMEVEPCIVTEGEMKRALERYYSVKTIVEQTLESMSEDVDLTLIKDGDWEQEAEKISIDMAEQEPVVRFVNSLLAQALNDGASDIHVEPAEKRMRVRMRIDGRLREIPSPERKMLLPIISRIKILAGMDIAKTRVPQDGRFEIREGFKEVGLRVSTFPTIHGEKAVLRLLDKNAALYGIDKLGLLPEEENIVKNVVKRPYGFFLSTGPTGSGKSTTLYAILNYINSPEKNIITIEDPVEYTVEGVSQTQVNPRAGVTFDTGLRAMLRQDPDIIMVGEIRDRETATIAVHSALTGHFVLSTLHTNDAPGAVTRLVEMGIEPFLVVSAVSCVVAQRLLRKICTECKEPYLPPQAVRATMSIEGEPVLYRGKGCPSCKYTGYKGRTGVYEVLVMDDAIKELVVDRCASDVIKKAAVERGMTVMRDDAMKKVLLGVTTLEEALDVTHAE